MVYIIGRSDWNIYFSLVSRKEWKIKFDIWIIINKMSLDFIKKCYSFEIADGTMILEEFLKNFDFRSSLSNLELVLIGIK